jgi:hypothetical protein
VILNIHGSSIDGWMDCPRRQAASSYGNLLKEAGYEVKELTRYVTPLIGTAIHSGADFLNQDYIRTGLLPTVDFIRKAYEQAVDKFQSMLMKDLENYEVRYTVKFPNLDTVKSHIAEYIQLYAEQILPQRKLELTEQHFNIQLNENFAYKSTIDSYGHGTLYDLKTGAIKTEAYHQIGTYVWLLTNAGYKVEAAQLDYILRPKENEPPKHVVIKYNPSECMELTKYATARIMNELTQFIETGNINVFSANPRSEGCNKIMCSLFGTTSCPGWRNK